MRLLQEQKSEPIPPLYILMEKSFYVFYQTLSFIKRVNCKQLVEPHFRGAT